MATPAKPFIPPAEPGPLAQELNDLIHALTPGNDVAIRRILEIVEVDLACHIAQMGIYSEAFNLEDAQLYQAYAGALATIQQASCRLSRVRVGLSSSAPPRSASKVVPRSERGPFPVSPVAETIESPGPNPLSSKTGAFQSLPCRSHSQSSSSDSKFGFVAEPGFEEEGGAPAAVSRDQIETAFREGLQDAWKEERWADFIDLADRHRKMLGNPTIDPLYLRTTQLEQHVDRLRKQAAEREEMFRQGLTALEKRITDEEDLHRGAVALGGFDGRLCRIEKKLDILGKALSLDGTPPKC